VTEHTDIEIRLLKVDDALQFRHLRLQALQDAPMAFIESYDEMAKLEADDYMKRLEMSTHIGAFAGGDLVGTMGYFVRPFEKQKHQGVLVGVYIKPEYRGKGISSRMLDALLAQAEEEVETMVLQVSVENFSARHCYLKAGFQTYGVEPKALKVGERYVDEEMMWLDLRQRQVDTY